MAYNRKLLYTKSSPSWNTPEGNLGDFNQEGNPITPIQLVATELKEPGSTITYAVTAGFLPTGLTLLSSGEISGTLTGYSGVQTVSFTVTATDDEGETASRDFNFTIKAPYSIEYLIVAGAGGGASGAASGSGGGGAGGLLDGSITVSSVNQEIKSIIVGAGGSAGQKGQDSSALGFVANGGGAGVYWETNATSQNSGGSGGGAGRDGGSGGTGIPGQGNNGGTTPFGPWRGASGGGGALTAGGNGGGTGYQHHEFAGNGGDGIVSTITGSSVVYSCGGGGATYSTKSGVRGGEGGSSNARGGRGDYSGSPTRSALPGDANSGTGGGGGASTSASQSGGSGVVILRMPTVSYSGTTTGSPTVTTDGSDTILTYTGSGTYTT